MPEAKDTTERRSELTPELAGPWAWRDFGSSYMLVADHGRRAVVLCADIVDRAPSSPRMVTACVITTRNQAGLLEHITPEHPVAHVIAAAPELLDVARSVLAMRENAHGCGLLDISASDLQRLYEAAEDAVGKAEGR